MTRVQLLGTLTYLQGRLAGYERSRLGCLAGARVDPAGPMAAMAEYYRHVTGAVTQMIKEVAQKIDKYDLGGCDGE